MAWLFAMVFTLTAIVVVAALLLLGMDLFDAVTHSFATIATGGFSPKNSSLAFYQNAAIEIVVIVFMVLSGLHFGLIFMAVTGNLQKIWKSAVARYYVLAMAVGVILVSIDVHGVIYPRWSDALRYAAFQLASLGTSTGFASTDTANWPPFSILVLIFFTLQCACAGSTSGGAAKTGSVSV